MHSPRVVPCCCTSLHQLRLDSRLHLDMRSCGFSADLIKQFCSELSDSNQPSVDAFLEQHKDNTDYENLGKAAIAACLISFEGTPAIADRNELKLYEYVWRHASYLRWQRSFDPDI